MDTAPMPTEGSTVWPLYDFSLTLDWRLINQLRVLDRFDARWHRTEEMEGRALLELRTMATIQSVGSSTRIEGAKLQDEQVDDLLQNLDISHLTDRDSQEVASYWETLELIVDEHEGIRITENEIKGLHQSLLRHVQREEWHRGGYKRHSNKVEARLPDGSRVTVFETTPQGHATEDAMRRLVEWFAQEQQVHPLVKVAAFTYEFLSIHPFQDGNGRLSRLLTNLLLLQSGYSWVKYVSLEHEIERRKRDYYAMLRQCQAQRPGEDVTPWVAFFLEVLQRMTERLLLKLLRSGVGSRLTPNEKALLAHIGGQPGISSGLLARRLKMPQITVKRMLAGLLEKGLLVRTGKGRGTTYSLA